MKVDYSSEVTPEQVEAIDQKLAPEFGVGDWETVEKDSGSVLGPGHCDTCRWWGRERAHDDVTPVGTCRATPPLPGKTQALAYHDPDRPDIPGPIITRAMWPWTAFDDWCSNYAQASRKR